jgi:hypothetical protein
LCTYTLLLQQHVSFFSFSSASRREDVVKISVVQDIMHNIDRRGDRGMCCNYAPSHNIVHTFTSGVFADDIRFAYLKIMGGGMQVQSCCGH